jgi:hypothetical protein
VVDSARDLRALCGGARSVRALHWRAAMMRSLRPLLALALAGASLTACFDTGEPTTGTTSDDVRILPWPVPITMPPPDPGWANPLPPDAIIGGADDDGTPLIVCRAWVGLQWLPGKTRADWGTCDIGLNGSETFISDYHVMVPAWAARGAGVLANQAPPAIGHAADGTAQYFCRGNYNGSLVPGHMGEGDAGCHVGWGNQEIVLASYQILSNASLPMQARGSFPGLMQKDAIVAGTEADGTPLYLCLGVWNGGLYPGKMQSGWGACDIGGGGTEQWATTYQVVVPHFETSGPMFPAGDPVNGLTVGACRASINGAANKQVGRTHYAGTCEIGYGGRDVSVNVGVEQLSPLPPTITITTSPDYVSTDPLTVPMWDSRAPAWPFTISYSGPQQGQLVYQMGALPFPSDPSYYGDAADVIDQVTQPYSPIGGGWTFNYDFTKNETRINWDIAANWARAHGDPLPPPPLLSNDPADMYLRAVLVDPSGRAIASSPTMHILYGTFPSPNLKIASPPTLGSIHFAPVGPPDQDWQYWVHCTKVVGLFCPDTQTEFDAKPQSDSGNWVTDIGNFLSQVVDWIRDAWNAVVTAYADIKNGVIDTVASMADCTDACKAVLEAGLDAAMTAAGLPPSLPDFDTLVKENAEYLAEEVAAQTGGVVPKDVADALVDKMADQLKGAHDGTGTIAWLAPAEDKQYRPGVFTVHLTGTGNPMGTFVIADQSGRFEEAHGSYPALPVGKTIDVPIVLNPKVAWDQYLTDYKKCIAGLTPDVIATGGAVKCMVASQNAFNGWHGEYSTGTDTFHVSFDQGASFDRGTQTFDLSVAATVYY